MMPSKNVSTPDPSASRILLVEHDSEQAGWIQTHLAESGYEVSCAATGEEARALYAEEAFDLYLVDCRLSDLPGHQLIAELKVLHPSCPCILLSDDSEAQLAEHALNFGADGFITRPIDAPLLHSLIEGRLFHRMLVQEQERFQGVLQTLRTFRHEMSNPLQGLLGSTELLLRRIPSDPKAERYAEQIRTAIDRMMNLMERLDAMKSLVTRESAVGTVLDLPPLPHGRDR